MSYTRNRTEQETIISFDESDGTAKVYTASRAMLRKLEKLEKAYPDSVVCTWVEPTEKITPMAKKYQLPISYIKLRGPRQMSERQRQVLEEARQAKTSQNQF